MRLLTVAIALSFSTPAFAETIDVCNFASDSKLSDFAKDIDAVTAAATTGIHRGLLAGKEMRMKRLALCLLFLLPSLAFAAEPIASKTPRPRPTYTPRPVLAGTSPQDAVAQNVLDQGPKRYARKLTMASDTGHWPALFERYVYLAESVRELAKSCAVAGSDTERMAAAEAMLASKATDVTLDPTTYVADAETKASSELSPLRAKEKEPADWQTKPAWLTVSSVGLSSSGALSVGCGAAWIGPSSEIASCYVLTKSGDEWKPACSASLYRH